MEPTNRLINIYSDVRTDWADGVFGVDFRYPDFDQIRAMLIDLYGMAEFDHEDLVTYYVTACLTSH